MKHLFHLSFDIYPNTHAWSTPHYCHCNFHMKWYKLWDWVFHHEWNYYKVKDFKLSYRVCARCLKRTSYWSR